jgi:hypothetical protein
MRSLNHPWRKKPLAWNKSQLAMPKTIGHTNNMKTGIEVNGPANIIMLLQAMLDQGKISQEDHDKLVAQAERTIIYIRNLQNPNGYKWHETMEKEAV